LKHNDMLISMQLLVIPWYEYDVVVIIT